MTEASNVLSQCLNISNAYKVKHEELKEVFNAYKSLKKSCKYNCEEIEIELEKISKEMQGKIISKETFNRLLDEQSVIMKEFNDINLQISKLYPDF